MIWSVTNICRNEADGGRQRAAESLEEGVGLGVTLAGLWLSNSEDATTGTLHTFIFD